MNAVMNKEPKQDAEVFNQSDVGRREEAEASEEKEVAQIAEFLRDKGMSVEKIAEALGIGRREVGRLVRTANVLPSKPAEEKLNRIVEKEKVTPKQAAEEFLKQKKKCFIATAAYGTPFAQEINVLRDFRDSFMKPYVPWSVRLYYKISPPIASLISKSHLLRKMVRKSES